MSDQGPPTESPAPMFVLHTPEVDFIENRMPQYHPAFDLSGLRYSPTQSQFVPLLEESPAAVMHVPGPSTTLAPPPAAPALPQPRPTPGSINDMGFWAEVFPEAMNRLSQDPLPYSGPYQPQWGIRHLSVWPDVQAKLDMARRNYDGRNGQYAGQFRRKLRRVMDKVTVPLQQGMKLIPDVDLASPVLGVVDLLLDAYRQAGEVRETINSGFDDLPEAFTRMDFYFKSYPNDDNIYRASVDVVLAIFRAIEEATRFYTSAQVKHAGHALLDGKEYQRTLVRSLTEIRAGFVRLETEARSSLTHRVLSDGDEARSSHAANQQDHWITHQVLGTIMQEAQESKAGIAFVCSILKHVLPLLVDQERNWPPRSPFHSRPTSPAGLLLQADPGPPPWTPRELWSRLHIPNLDETDLLRVLRNAGETLPEERGRAEQVLTTPLFRAWMVGPGSAKLLVHGDFDSDTAASRPVSPFSVLCATVVKALRLPSPSSSAAGGGTGKFVSLVFFCGCHFAYDDEYRGGGAMIRSLVAQLLRQFPADSIEPDPGVAMQEVERGDVAQLCRLFVYLVRRLPARMTVFCLIDSINEYESEEYLHGMDAVVLELLGLVDESATAPGKAKFKLLLMSPRPTVAVRQVFDYQPGALLHMAQLPMLEGGGSFARIQDQLRAGEGARRNLEEME